MGCAWLIVEKLVEQSVRKEGENRMPFERCYACMKPVRAGWVQCPSCGASIPCAPNSPSSLQPGYKLGRFIIGKEIGHGGFGITYIAFDERLQAERCIKEYFPHQCRRLMNMHPDVTGENRELFTRFAARFLKEAQIMSALTNRNVSNIASVHDQIDTNGTTYIIMDYLDGSTMDKYLVMHQRGIDCQEIKTIMESVLKTVSDIHRAGYIHRDLSLSNIMHLRDGSVRIIDFGSAETIEDAMNRPQAIWRTSKKYYSAPEQIRSESQGPWTDIYALGVCMFKMAAGGLPQNWAPGMKYPSLQDIDHAIPGEFDRVIAKATQPDPSMRYQSAEEMLADVDKIACVKVHRSHRLLIAIAAGLTVIAGVILMAFLFRDEPEKQVNMTATLTESPDYEEQKVMTDDVGQIIVTVAQTRETVAPIIEYIPAATGTLVPESKPAQTTAAAKIKILPVSTPNKAAPIAMPSGSAPTATPGILGTRTQTDEPPKVTIPERTEAPSTEKPKEAAIPKLEIGSYITFGSYPQNGGDKEPIEWQVLDVSDNKALLISRYGLDAQAYNKQYVTITWENSSLRKWLNDTFLFTAFSAKEQESILVTHVDNGRSQGYEAFSTDGGKDTDDKIFLLSYAEAARYFAGDTPRKCVPTSYARHQGVLVADDSNVNGKLTGRWWLRSPGKSVVDAGIIDQYGVLEWMYVNWDEAMVRPVLWVDIRSMTK